MLVVPDQLPIGVQTVVGTLIGSAPGPHAADTTAMTIAKSPFTAFYLSREP